MEFVGFHQDLQVVKQHEIDRDDDEGFHIGENHEEMKQYRW